MDLAPTNSDDEVQELSETLQSMPSSRKSSKKKGQNCKVHPIGNIDFSFVFEIIVRKSQLNLHFSFCISSF